MNETGREYVYMRSLHHIGQIYMAGWIFNPYSAEFLKIY